MPQEKTVFIQPEDSLKSYPDQWELLKSIKRIGEDVLDTIIELNDLDNEKENYLENNYNGNTSKVSGFSLPLCIRRILTQGVTFDQRVACFRIAVHLKRVGMPFDTVVATLMNWRLKNKPQNNKRIITSKEIEEQVRGAFKKSYTGYGCNESVISYFCDPDCPIKLRVKNRQEIIRLDH